MKADIKKEALAIHKKLKGKIEVVSKAKLTKKDLSLFYTPGVASVSAHLAAHPESAKTLTARGNMVAVVSDGSAVLGLGNIGPTAALPVMEGKAMLFKSLAGIDAFPLVLDTQDPESIIETVKNLEPSFGAINLEDIAAPQCFEIERRLKQEMNIPVMHDDQHGTAMVVLAGLINALKVRKSDKTKVKVVINGAGAAGTAIANLLILYGFSRIVMVDSQGAVYKGRKNLTAEKEMLASMTNLGCHAKSKSQECVTGDLRESLRGADVFIGVSKGGILKKDMVRAMNEQPIIFALANPVPEILPNEAKQAGALVVATGRSDFPNQINNALGFPGIFRGALDHNVEDITDAMLIQAAVKLANVVKKPESNLIIPSVFDKAVVKAVASAIRSRS